MNYCIVCEAKKRDYTDIVAMAVLLTVKQNGLPMVMHNLCDYHRKEVDDVYREEVEEKGIGLQAGHRAHAPDDSAN